MTIKIYGRANSLNVQKVLWFAHELNLPFEHIPAGKAFGIIHTEAFLKLNPNGLIPLLEDEHTSIWESQIILRYLAEVYGKEQIWIANPQRRFQAEQWLDWYITTLLPKFTIIFYELVRTPPEQQRIEILPPIIQEIEKHLAILEALLIKQPYISGEKFGIADIPLGLALHHWFNFNIERQSHPHLEAWIQNIRQRPSFEKVAYTL
ncbi:glutathione S-transferase family protein [Acinetobacter nectaris]|uniref:glutathione S-transferase family protein n=1 Tax=Acinetobacter nectaris TaxID=1219382 RepID=UPI001F4611D4|nr:glutathione S-transferase family protein [Acinetobacter nectaris]MCF9045288.1 glutathione S-transferase family protein [Acinetobacter nectaris]